MKVTSGIFAFDAEYDGLAKGVVEGVIHGDGAGEGCDSAFSVLVDGGEGQMGIKGFL